VDEALIVVIPSAGYADFLAVSGPAWRAFLPEADIRVVTTLEDVQTVELAERLGVRCLITDAWRKDGAPLNKGAALDDALGITCRWPAVAPLHEGQLCLAVDADTVPFGVFPTIPPGAANVLYGCPRYACTSMAELDAYRRGEVAIGKDLPLIVPRVKGHDPDTSPQVSPAEAARRALGYFQLFRWRPGVSFGSYPSAGKYDIAFRQHFTRREAVTSMHVLHLGPMTRKNWRGRVIPRWAS
jgi:hypothetical protein